MIGPVRHLLFDFGDTLVREPFCTIAPPEVPDFEARVLAAYAEARLIERWDGGEIRYEEVAARVAEKCGISVEATRAAMVHNWRNLRVNRTAFDFAREIGRTGRAAIVTVAPHVFTEVISPHYGLDRDFRVIVTSWQERNIDKADLCEIALDRLGAAGALGTALLVDNRADNIEAFRARGGQGYLFTDDATFARDLPNLRSRLA